MQKVFLKGNITRVPEVKVSEDKSTLIAKTSIACNKLHGKENKVTFFNLVAFNKKAEFFEKYVRQGTPLVIVGDIENDKYKDKEGVAKDYWQVTVDSVEFAGTKKSDEKDKDEKDSSGGRYSDR